MVLIQTERFREQNVCVHEPERSVREKGSEHGVLAYVRCRSEEYCRCCSQFPELRNARQNAGERDLHDPKNTKPLAASTNSDTRIQDAIPAFDCCVGGVKRGVCETLRLVCPTRRDTPK